MSSILLGVLEGTIIYVARFTPTRKGVPFWRQAARIQVGHHMDPKLSPLEPFNVPLLGKNEIGVQHPTPNMGIHPCGTHLTPPHPLRVKMHTELMVPSKTPSKIDDIDQIVTKR